MRYRSIRDHVCVITKPDYEWMLEMLRKNGVIMFGKPISGLEIIDVDGVTPKDVLWGKITKHTLKRHKLILW